MSSLTLFIADGFDENIEPKRYYVVEASERRASDVVSAIPGFRLTFIAPITIGELLLPAEPKVS